MFWEEITFKRIRTFTSRISKNELGFLNNRNELISFDVECNEQGILKNSKSQIDVSAQDNNISIISSGYHTVLLKQDGTVWACGRNNFCQCGQQDLTVDIPQFTHIKDLTDIIQISCGTHHSVALDRNGQVWLWGTIHNTLFFQTWEDSPHQMPHIIEGLSNIIWVECGQEFFYALDDRGILWGYGSNYYGSLGTKADIFAQNPVQVHTNLSGIISVHVCFKEAYAITKDKSVLRWVFDRTNIDNHVVLKCTNPEAAEGLKNVVALSTSTSNAIALTEQGELWSWGNNFDAVLGYETKFDIGEEDFFKLGLITNIPLNPICVAISNASAIVIYKDDEVWGWGASFASSTPVRMLPQIDMTTRTPIPSRTAYNNHYIAFLDILGFKNLVYGQYGDFGSLVIKSKMELLSHLNENFKRFDTSVMLMSDSIVVSIKEDVPDALVKFLYTVSEINGMLNGSVLRGAISFGSLYHKNNIVFGPAFISAYQLQEHEAVYPRIIIKPSVIRTISKISEHNEYLMKNYFLLDDDKEIFFDYLSFLRDIEYLHLGRGLNGVVGGLTYAIMLNFLSSPAKVDKSVAEKYEWLLKYLFIWQITNPKEYASLISFKFKLLYISNPENIRDRQDCRPLFNQKMIIKHGNYVLLTDNKCFPTNTLQMQTHNSFAEGIKTMFSCVIEIDETYPVDIFESIGIDIYMDTYEKRPILETTQYTLWELSRLEAIKDSKYYWVRLEEITDNQKAVIKALISDEGQ